MHSILESLAACIKAGAGLAVMLLSCAAVLVFAVAIFTAIDKATAKRRADRRRKREKRIREEVRAKMKVLKDE